MPDVRFEKMQVLIVDDFDNFRNMLTDMLLALGVINIEVAASDRVALRLCNTKAYDIILCDQILGQGKSGQQVLETLRHTPNRNNDTMFVLISAETNKNIIMAAFDYEPDDYLTKPITPQILEQRLSRLLAQRLALAPIYQALKDLNIDTAIDLCRSEIGGGKRYGNHCQKLLGRLLLANARYSDAEQLFGEILDMRQLDWAMLGIAKVKKAQGDFEGAKKYLKDIIEFSPMYLKAYDVLVEVYRELNDPHAQQHILQQALAISPLSILRQQALGDVALKNNDVLIAVEAYRNAVLLGENSCHNNIDVHKNFARSTILLGKIDKDLAKPMLREALTSVDSLTDVFGKGTDNKVVSSLLEAQLQNAVGDDKKSKDAMIFIEKTIYRKYSSLSLPTKIEWVNAIRGQGDFVEAERVTAELLKEYAGNEDALQKIDSLLEEPCSMKNKALIAKINKAGIAYYEAKDFAKAVESFKSALVELPQLIGLHLNLLQSLVELLRLNSQDEQTLQSAKQTVGYVSRIIPATHPQYYRFSQLEEVYKHCVKHGVTDQNIVRQGVVSERAAEGAEQQKRRSNM
ncbi:MAG: response regulator [Pseudomonadota bacterium]